MCRLSKRGQERESKEETNTIYTLSGHAPFLGSFVEPGAYFGFMHVCVCVFVFMCVCVWLCKCVLECMFVYDRLVCVCVYASVCECMCVFMSVLCLSVGMHVCVWVRATVCTRKNM